MQVTFRQMIVVISVNWSNRFFTFVELWRWCFLLWKGFRIKWVQECVLSAEWVGP